MSQRVILHVVGPWYPQNVGIYVLNGLSGEDAAMIARCHGCDVSCISSCPAGSVATSEDLLRVGNALSDSHEIPDPTPGYDSRWVDNLSQEGGPFVAKPEDVIVVVMASEW